MIMYMHMKRVCMDRPRTLHALSLCAFDNELGACTHCTVKTI